MENSDDIDELERLIVQLQGLHDEISQLAKKSPNDALNPFKLKLVNKILEVGNTVLINGYRPFSDFAQFDSDDMPTNSDVTMIISQYIQQAERFRSDNVVKHDYKWVYVLSGKPSDIPALEPTRVGSSKK